jgi:hypothetical protein
VKSEYVFLTTNKNRGSLWHVRTGNISFSAHGSSRSHPQAHQLKQVKNGSILKFTLSLPAGDNRNLLEVSIDGGSNITLTQGDALVDAGGVGFVPVASLCGKYSIRCLGYE